MQESDSILIVDDDREIRSLLAAYLEKNGYRALTAGDGREMRACLDRHRVDLVVLDLMLPGEDGLDLCRDLRARTSLPVVMLTARGEETDRIVGLEIGADDYVPKPFNPRELLARIRAVLRRSRALPESALVAGEGYCFGRWRVDTRSRSLRDADDVVVPLSAAEYDLLMVFLTHPGRVLDRDQLMDLTRGRDAMPFDRSIDMQVSRLRKRLGTDADNSEYIKTVRSKGYLFVPEVTPA
ncbi:MAG: response regulator [Gammaproteobacteria bacterium]|nr:response regulator [Gammaproteobacteria bacterium]